MATHSSILAWRIPWTEEPGGLQSIGSQRVGHDWTQPSVCPCKGKTVGWYTTLCQLGHTLAGAFSLLPTATISLLADPFPTQGSSWHNFWVRQSLEAQLSCLCVSAEPSLEAMPQDSPRPGTLCMFWSSDLFFFNLCPNYAFLYVFPSRLLRVETGLFTSGFSAPKLCLAESGYLLNVYWVVNEGSEPMGWNQDALPPFLWTLVCQDAAQP